MATLIDLTGQKFDKLLVLEKAPSRNKHVYWKCLCDCGNICEKSSEYLKRPTENRDCGCSKKINIKKQKAEERFNKYVGQRFGRLVVIKNTGKRTDNNKYPIMLCQCDCGNLKEVPSYGLTNGHTKSCGCLAYDTHFIDITNQKFGKLTALYVDPENNKKWICKCDCGNIKSVNGNNLRRGLTQSCGCINYSIGEKNIQNILEENHITYATQYHPKDGFGYYDFAIFENNKLIRLIEFDGEQHYNPVRGWNGYDELEVIQKRDNIKNEYAKNHNVPLIRIAYTKRDSITIEMLLGNDYLVN